MKVQSILVVEDSDEDQFLNSMIIEEYDARINVHQAYNGQEALDQLYSGLSPDLILLDINMPLLDGFGFLDSYQHVCSAHPESVVVMLSSSGQTGDIKKAQTYACVRQYLLKPLTVEALRSLVKGISPVPT